MLRMESTDSGSTSDPGSEPFIVNVVQSTQFHGDPRDTYRARSNPKGWVLLINNEAFETETSFSTRVGALVDERNLETLFIQMGLKVLVKRNLKKAEMMEELNRFSELEDHLTYDMAVVCVCSYGVDKNKIITSDCKEVDVEEDIMSKFNNDGCEKLKGKPKMFIFQDCQGKREDFGIIDNIDSNTEATRSGSLNTWTGSEMFKKGPYEDMLIVTFTTIPGNVSMMDHYTGAGFLQCFCKVLMENSHNTAILRMLDMVILELREQEEEERNIVSCTYKSQNFYKQLFFNPGMSV